MPFVAGSSGILVDSDGAGFRGIDADKGGVDGVEDVNVGVEGFSGDSDRPRKPALGSMVGSDDVEELVAKLGGGRDIGSSNEIGTPGMTLLCSEE